ncbi:ImcF-related family protein, partial [Pseudomonas sp. NPDC007930]|uniref:ImcF-related family protein n=1 Tax=Pseudomonas sp. NPDC007930 TaxID=3364417 RepID=UPI0036E7D634
WRKLCPRRPFDAIVWALSAEQSATPVYLDTGLRHLRNLGHTLRWQAPLHLWEVCSSQWPQPGHPNLPAGCLLNPTFNPEEFAQQLAALPAPLCASGMFRLNRQVIHDFYYRLSWTLAEEGIARWREALRPQAAVLARGLWLRGLWFSLPLARAEGGPAQLWQRDAAWDGILKDTAQGQWAGWPLRRLAYLATLATPAILLAGVLLAYTSNRAEIANLHSLQQQLHSAATPRAIQLALHNLSLEASRLATRADEGAPWYARFGLDRTKPLLAQLWPAYAAASQRHLRDPLAAQLATQLTQLGNLPAGDLAREAHAQQGYEALKAYLMLTRPQQHLDAAFLTRVGSERGLLPALWPFYAEQLPRHPEWALAEDAKLVARARQVLLAEMGQRSAENGLYAQVLASVANDYPSLALADLAGDTDAAALFSTAKSVPAVFTRQAWEGRVREAIEQVAEARREQVDWVLSDQPGSLKPALTPEALKQRLTARYRQDYANAWRTFLNSLRWQPARGLNGTLEQLALLSDAQQSPLKALLTQVAWHGQAGDSGPALGQRLLAQAQKIIQRPEPTALQPPAPASAFSPWQQLLSPGDPELSLAAYLNRLTAVRLKLEQVSQAADPQATALALAQSVFQGKGLELTEPQAFGRLLAASLGAQWHGAGQALFVQPLEQAWQRLLAPSARSLNSQWQQGILAPWNSAFAGRYPFAAAGTGDASLAMLGQMVRRDSGRIDSFLQRELAGVLRRQGNRWVAEPGQGLRVNPAFLTAVNQLGELADVLYTDGALGMGF